MRVTFAFSMVLVSSLSASAAPNHTQLPTGPRPRVVGDPTLHPRPLIAPAPSSRIIYLRRCPAPAGCPIFGGTGIDNSMTDTSSLVPTSNAIVGPFNQSDSVWKQVVTCVKATYAPFDIAVTDVDPGNVPHYEHLVGGHPRDLNRTDIDDAGGVSPATCSDLPNAMTFTFDVWGPDPNRICSVVAQETAHSFGLEHEMLPPDPMTYLSGPMPKRFQAMDAPCGEYQDRPCDCGPGMQNSYKYIVDLFGPGVATPPTVAIHTPAAGTTVTPRFIARIDATDDVAVEHVELTLDGEIVGMTTEKPYKIQVPDGIAEGPHTIMATAFDVQGTPAVSDSLDITMGPPCTAAAGCEGTDVCVQGLCVAGPDAPGGLGDFCQADTECISGHCITDSSGDRACVEICDLSPGSCPSGFSCIPASGAAGVCWADASGGCCDAGGNPAGAMLLGLGVLGFALLPRRHRR